jgi:prepilin-type N-terminal cleavage/methylation domain-containing protein
MQRGMQSGLRRAFTLVELLVVVAIIAVLIALLLPSLAAAKKHAIDAACLAQEHGINLATQLYVSDSGGNYQPSYWCPNPPATAALGPADILTPYMVQASTNSVGVVDTSNTQKIFRCPAVSYPTPPKQFPLTYGFNASVHSYQGLPMPATPLKRNNNMMRPSEIICLADSILSSGAETTAGYLSYTNGWDTSAPMTLYDTWGPVSSQGDGDVSTEFHTGYPYLVCYRHGTNTKGSLNAVFEDGHGETIPQGTLRFKNFCMSY